MDALLTTTPVPFRFVNWADAAAELPATKGLPALFDFKSAVDAASSAIIPRLGGTELDFVENRMIEAWRGEIGTISVRLIIGAWKACANDEMTKPIQLGEPLFSRRSYVRASHRFQMNLPSEYHRVLQNKSERPAPEFEWNSTLYRALQAVQDFSTNADR
jgi:hypothetical protein